MWSPRRWGASGERGQQPGPGFWLPTGLQSGPISGQRGGIGTIPGACDDHREAQLATTFPAVSGHRATAPAGGAGHLTGVSSGGGRDDHTGDGPRRTPDLSHARRPLVRDAPPFLVVVVPAITYCDDPAFPHHDVRDRLYPGDARVLLLLPRPHAAAESSAGAAARVARHLRDDIRAGRGGDRCPRTDDRGDAR